MPPVFQLLFVVLVIGRYSTRIGGQGPTGIDDTPASYAKEQRRLIRQMVDSKSYDSRVRPVITGTQPINVTIRMNLYQIVDINERQQFVMLYCWMTQMWLDWSLAWDPAQYSNITMIVLPYTEIWLPDTYLYNNLAMVREDSEHWINAILQMEENTTSAHVTFRYPALYKFACNMDVRYFPFDKQYCTMVFGSWTYDTTGVDFFPEKEDVAKEDFSESEEWTLLSFKAHKFVEKYACCPEPFSLLRLHLIIERKPLHYVVNLIIPTVIISLISNVGFFTPTKTGSERCEKVNLGITTLLAFAILLLMVSDQMPTTSASIPLIGWFLLGIMIQTSVATLATAIILSIQRRALTGKRLSANVRQLFFNRVSPVLFVQAPPLLKTHLIFEPLSDYSIFVCSSTQETIVPKDSPSPDDTSPECQTNEQFRNAKPAPPSASVSKSSASEQWKLKDRPKRSQSDTKSGASGQGAPKVKQIIAAEYEWFSAILDRVCLIASLSSVVALVLCAVVIGQVKGK